MNLEIFARVLSFAKICRSILSLVKIKPSRNGEITLLFTRDSSGRDPVLKAP